MEKLQTKNIISELKFKGIWRDYQIRCLKCLENYLDDNKLNIVAAPGAGKTILGIEVISRLKNNALILAPSITIRNQWKQRIVENFCRNKTLKEQISTNYEEPAPITVITYQALHSIFKDEEKRTLFLNQLTRYSVKTFVFDEAHHLRAEWYRTLEQLLKLTDKNKITVSLTGTPPYDVSPAEWRNYHKIAGEVDAEISIPELVKAGDLCPHQDLIYFSELTKNEKILAEDIKNSTGAFLNYLKNSAEFLYIIKNSPFLKDLDKNIELIYEDLSFTISLISWLFSNDSMDMDGIILTEFLKLEKENIPVFETEIAETMMNGIIGKFEKYFKNAKELRLELKKLNLLSSPRKVDLKGQKALRKISSSKSKIESIKQITQTEYRNLGNNLKEAILLDYVQKGENLYINTISVFDELKKIKGIKPAVLTGTVVIIPECAKEELYRIANRLGITKENIIITPYDENYLRVVFYSKTPFVRIVTELFETDNINVLIGTTALLGEGWDCPAVNTLVIASNVGSFMLSNQMRGRALRIDKMNPEKTADIWHLVSIGEEYSNDLDTVKKRFETFEGISETENRIQNKIERLGFKITQNSNVSKLNRAMLEKSKNRAKLKNNWKQIFKESEITEAKLTQKMYEITAQTVKLKEIQIKYLPKPIYNFFNKIVKKYNYKKDCDSSLRIAYSILNVLCKAQYIKTPFENLKIKHLTQNENTFCLTLLNAQNREISIFTKALCDFYTPAEEQKYILKKENKYIAIPEILSSNKKYTEELVKKLEPELGYLDIILTRTPEGRAELLKAKYNPYFKEKVSNKRIWL